MTMTNKRLTQGILRWATRVLFLLLAVFLFIGGPLPEWSVRIFPALSPLAAFTGVVTRRAWYLGMFWALPPVIVLILACWRGRFFCRWLCPAGTLHSLAAKAGLRKKIVNRRLGGIFFWAILVGAAVGTPSLFFLDPLAGFNRSAVAIQEIHEAATWIPGLILPGFIIIGIFQPMIWCSHFCPLGYAFDLVDMRRKKPLYKQAETRRSVIAGIALGLPLAFLSRYVPKSLRPGQTTPVLPPGAESIGSFAGACSRCYACVKACPTKVIRVKPPINRSLAQFFHPEMDYQNGYCDEFCNQCSQACPTTALQPLTIDAKRTRQIGVAKVRRDACLAWADGEHCMVCQEFCPYLAIDTDKSTANLPRPVVNPEICRGCGVCQNRCPAIRAGVAIVVHGIQRQARAKSYDWNAL